MNLDLCDHFVLANPVMLFKFACHKTQPVTPYESHLRHFHGGHLGAAVTAGVEASKLEGTEAYTH